MEAVQRYQFRTKLTEAAELVSEGYEAYLKRRLEEQRRAEERLKEISELALKMEPYPMKGERYIVVARRGDKTYLRKNPTKPPTPAKAKTWEVAARLMKAASQMTYEEVAGLVGGRVVDVGIYTGNDDLRGRKGILVDGQLLNKTAAVLKLMKNRRFAVPETATERLVRLLRWALYLED